MSRWWRAYDEAVDDPKLQRLSGEQFKTWFNLCCLTSKNGGTLPPLDEVAFKLRMKPDRLQLRMADLRDAGLIDDDETGSRPHNWNGRQYKSDVSTPRVKRFREQQRNVSSAVSVTPPETESDTEPETERKNARKRASPAFDEFWRLYPNKVGKQLASKVFDRIEKNKTVTFENMMAGLDKYIRKTDDRPWCNPATWLNEGRWDDQPAASKPNGTHHGKRSLSDEADERIARAEKQQRAFDLDPADYHDAGDETGERHRR